MLITVGPDNHTGFRKHLEELSHLVNDGVFIPVNEKFSKKTLPKIIQKKPSLTIIGGRNWVKRNHNILSKIPGKKGILYTSPLAQAEISNEEIKNLQIYFQWLDSKKIDYLFFSSKSLSDLFNRKDVFHLPAPSTKEAKLSMKIKNFPERNIVGLINDKALHKNILNTIAGISLSKKTEKFIVNGLSEEYFDMLKRMGLEKITKDVGFLEDKKYKKTLESLKVLLHLSFSESFCYSVFEAMIMGTPVLVSRAVDWVKIKKLIVNNPRDHKEIANKLDYKILKGTILLIEI
jgi:glycosyltransferase involved in cell wall biosynthesis